MAMPCPLGLSVFEVSLHMLPAVQRIQRELLPLDREGDGVFGR